MKTYFCFFALFFALQFQAVAQADAIDRYFDQYVEDERFTVVYISAKMFNLISKLDVDAQDQSTQDAMEVIQDLRGLRILTTDTLTNQFYKEAIQKIDTKEYEVLMTVRDGDENVRFLVKDDKNDRINELLLLVGGKDSFVLLSFLGDIDLNKISALSNKLEVKGATHLDKIKDNQ